MRWPRPPGLRLARFRSIPLPPAYFHRFAILTHNPQHSRVCRSLETAKTRRSLHLRTRAHTHTHAHVGGGQHVPSICSEGFGRPVSIFSRFSFIGCRLWTAEWKTTRKPLTRKAVPDVGYRAEKTGAVYFSSRKRKFQRFVPSLPLNPKSHGDSVIDTGCEVKCIVEIFSEGRYVIVREIVLGFFIGPCTALCSVELCPCTLLLYSKVYAKQGI